MPSKLVSDAIQARQAAVWTVRPVYYPNEAVKPPSDGTPFVVAEYPIGTAETLTMSGHWFDRGTLRYVVHTPLRDGPDDGLTYCDALAAAFRNMRIDITDGWVKFGYPSSPVALGDDGAYYRFSTSIPFTSFVD